MLGIPVRYLVKHPTATTPLVVHARRGALVVDDIDANNGFSRFVERLDVQIAPIAEAKSVRPDRRRFNQKDLLGIVLTGIAA